MLIIVIVFLYNNNIIEKYVDKIYANDRNCNNECNLYNSSCDVNIKMTDFDKLKHKNKKSTKYYYCKPNL